MNEKRPYKDDIEPITQEEFINTKQKWYTVEQMAYKCGRTTITTILNRIRKGKLVGRKFLGGQVICYDPNESKGFKMEIKPNDDMDLDGALNILAKASGYSADDLRNAIFNKEEK